MIRALLIVSLLVALLTGCCPEAHDLTIIGMPMPADTALVIQIAQAHADREIVGAIDFRATGDESTGEDGHCSWEGGGCPMDAWVTVHDQARTILPDESGQLVTFPCPGGNSAICTSLAHEIGHWVLQSEDEVAVQAWANVVNLEALRRLGR